MLDKETYIQLKWIIARSELVDYKKRGSFEYLKPVSDSTFDMHNRVSGVHLGIRSVQLPEIIDWLEQLKPNLFKINQYDAKISHDLLPQIGIYWQEFECEPMSNTVHTVLEFLNYNKEKIPVVFENEYWYHQKIIDKKIKHLDELNENNCLVITIPFYSNFQARTDMNDILLKCTELNIPVLLDLIWLPMLNSKIKLNHTECVQVITHGFSKTIPIAGIKGGFVFWKKPINDSQRIYPLGNKLSFWICKKYLETFGYDYVKDNLKTLQKKWCEIFGIKEHNLSYVGEIPEGHWLESEHLHTHEFNSKTKLFNLTSYYENDIILTKFINDNTNTT